MPPFRTSRWVPALPARTHSSTSVALNFQSCRLRGQAGDSARSICKSCPGLSPSAPRFRQPTASVRAAWVFLRHDPAEHSRLPVSQQFTCSRSCAETPAGTGGLGEIARVRQPGRRLIILHSTAHRDDHPCPRRRVGHSKSSPLRSLRLCVRLPLRPRRPAALRVRQGVQRGVVSSATR
jgi:hypothetical protein